MCWIINWIIPNWKRGNKAAVLLNPTDYELVEIIKIRNSCPIGENGNILVKYPNNHHEWVLESNLITERNAMKQIKHNRRFY
jgi:hypothetical protein